MSALNDGGPAFARDSHIDRQTGLVVQQNGMTLRDYFAAAALQGISDVPGVGRYQAHQWAKEWAQWSYSVSDAMLAERARKEAQP